MARRGRTGRTVAAVAVAVAETQETSLPFEQVQGGGCSTWSRNQHRCKIHWLYTRAPRNGSHDKTYTKEMLG